MFFGRRFSFVLFTTILACKASAQTAGSAWIRVDFTYDTFPDETAWSLLDANGSVLDEHPVGTISDSGLARYSYRLDPGQYYLEMSDTFGDGICCNFGLGNVRVYQEGPDGDTLLAGNNGRFGASVTTPFVARPPGEISSAPIRLDFYYDDYPQENSWVLRRHDGVVIDQHEEGSLTTRQSVQYNHGLQEGTYTVDLNDFWHDGFCCQFGEGFLHVVLEGPGGDQTLASVEGPWGVSASTSFSVSVDDYYVQPPLEFIRLDFLFDQYPSETGWTLVRDDGFLVDSRSQGSIETTGFVAYRYAVPAGTYNLSVTDSFGDGFCCGDSGDGRVSVVHELSPSGGEQQVLATIEGAWNNSTFVTFTVVSQSDCAAPQTCESIIGCSTNNPDALLVENSPASLARDYVCRNSDANQDNLLQRFALATLAKSVTNRPTFLAELFPQPQQDECDSDYITCNTQGEVTHIHIEGLWLTTELPPELGLLSSSLEFLDANQNHFHGTVPSSFGALTNLRRFDVEQGGFTGHAFPAELCGLLQLRDFRGDCATSFCCLRFMSSEHYCAYKLREAARRAAAGLTGEPSDCTAAGLILGDDASPTLEPLQAIPIVQDCSGEMQSSTTSVTAPGTSQTQDLTLVGSTRAASDGTACVRGLLTVPEYMGPINIGIVIDISRSTYSYLFQGTEQVGDVNGDGKAETVLDAEIAAILKFLESIVATPGFDNTNVDIGIITFSDVGHFVGQFPPADPTDPSAVNPELYETLVNLEHATVTNFDDALDKAIEYFEVAPANRNNVMFFVSDGVPNVCGDGDGENQSCNTDEFIYASQDRSGARYYNSELNRLDELGVKRHSIGVGSASDVSPNSGLDLMDNTPDPVTGQKALQVTDTDALVGVLLANPIVGSVESFRLTLNGSDIIGIDKNSLVSSPVGFHYGNFVLNGFDVSAGASNRLEASCEMSFDGLVYSIQAEINVQGESSSTRRLLRRSGPRRL